MPESDEALMSLVKGGDREAFTKLFHRYKVPIMTFLHHYVGAYGRAEDLFQETFIRLWKYRRRYDETRRFRPWLYAIAANISRDEARKMRYRKAFSMDEVRDGQKPSDRIASSLPSPAEEAEGEESARILRKALGSLSNESRMAIMLHQFHGLKYREIAETLNIPIGTVKSRIHSALEQLRMILKGQITSN